MSTELRPTTPGEEEQLWRIRQEENLKNNHLYGGPEVLKLRATRSDKGRVRIMKCNRCGETLNNAKIVVTTTGLDGKLNRDRQRYCSQKCFNKSYRKGLSRLLPI